MYKSAFKLEEVVTEGKAATMKVQTPKRCVECESEGPEKFVKCQLCSSGFYCSDRCVETHRADHEKLCVCIQTLEEIEVAKVYRDLKRMEAGRPQRSTKIIRLVGERPLVDVRLEGTEVKCLWDTGSMVSIISKRFLEENWPDRKLHSVREFLGTKLSVSAANNSEVPIEGVVL